MRFLPLGADIDAAFAIPGNIGQVHFGRYVVPENDQSGANVWKFVCMASKSINVPQCVSPYAGIALVAKSLDTAE